MEKSQPDPAIENDVLHIENKSKLSAEEISKAIAHHNRRHGGDQPQQAAAKIAQTAASKKHK